MPVRQPQPAPCPAAQEAGGRAAGRGRGARAPGPSSAKYSLLKMRCHPPALSLLAVLVLPGSLGLSVLGS